VVGAAAWISTLTLCRRRHSSGEVFGFALGSGFAQA